MRDGEIGKCDVTLDESSWSYFAMLAFRTKTIISHLYPKEFGIAPKKYI